MGSLRSERCLDVFNRRHRSLEYDFAGSDIDAVEVSILASSHRALAACFRRNQGRRRGLVPIVKIMGHELIPAMQRASLRIEGDNRAGVEIGARAISAREIRA